MNRCIIVTICASLLLGAGPTTSPSSLPSTRPASTSNIPRIMADLRREIAALRAEVDALTKENADLKAQLAKLKPSTSPAKDDKVAAAIQSHKLVVGMTIAQAREAMSESLRPEGDLISESGDTRTYQWFFIGGANYIADFRNGVLMRWDRGN